MTDLFDLLDDDPGGEPCSQAGESPATVLFAHADDELPRSKWREVPQALFMSWSEARQLSYCVARDEDAALYATTLEEARWYQERAKSYER